MNTSLANYTVPMCPARCARCGIDFMVPQVFDEVCRANGRKVSCPKGHRNVYKARPTRAPRPYGVTIYRPLGLGRHHMRNPMSVNTITGTLAMDTSYPLSDRVRCRRAVRDHPLTSSLFGRRPRSSAD